MSAHKSPLQAFVMSCMGQAGALYGAYKVGAMGVGLLSMGVVALGVFA